MPPLKRWIIPALHAQAHSLASALRTSPLIAQVLLNRGLTSVEQCRRFLNPSLNDLHAPDQIHNLTRAADRINHAIRRGQRIVIYGDYDVDGIAATAILWHAIRLLGGTVHYYVPHRVDEGYGMNAEAVEKICSQGADLIVSVDCGITAVREAEIACARGVDLIITDHHEPQECLPRCYAVVHPRIGKEGAMTAYPNPDLCGSGVAFKLAWAIGQASGPGGRVSRPFRDFLVEATALAALGTIADVVPLIGENRVLARFGLGGLMQSGLAGIRALIESAGLTGRKLDSYHVGFLLAPRLNACGRMGHAREAVEMLTSADPARARQIADYLDQQNRRRQALERQILEQALQQAHELGLDTPDSPAVVLAAEGWHPGIIGIVAARIVERLNRPTIMIALANGHGHGSGRSIPGFDLAQALQACRQYLETCGGHEMAAGLRLDSTRLEAFRQAFADYARRKLQTEQLAPVLKLEAETDLRQLTLPLVTDLERLAPFGIGNPRPLLAVSGLEVVGQPRRVGRNAEHLQFSVCQGRSSIRCIAFGQGAIAEQLQGGRKVDLAVQPIIDEFNGQRSVKLQVEDLHLV